MATRAVHVTITGRVHGVGYRAFVDDAAIERGLVGWVRNRRDGSVEAVLSGDEDAVDELVALCRDGPPAAIVMHVATEDYSGPVLTSFSVLRTE